MQHKKNKEAAVVVFSGGQDSTTCLLWALKKYKKVYAVSFDYGQRHALELECAKEIADKFGVEHHILDMSLLNQLAPNSLTRTDMKVDENAPEEGTPNSFVDGRNMVLRCMPYRLIITRDMWQSLMQRRKSVRSWMWSRQSWI